MNVNFSKIIEDRLMLLRENLPTFENKIFLVGGIVRDALLDKESYDMDFCIDCYPYELEDEIYKKFGIRSIINEKFFSCKFELNNVKYEFTSSREDYYSQKSRYPKSCKRVKIEKDPYRRDFNINTLMVNINEPNNVIDFTGKGLNDLENKIIDTPVDPFKSFNDDPLRILRAIRFSTRFDFKIQENVLDAIIFSKDRLKILSKNAIKKELSLMNSNGLKLIENLGFSNVVNI